MLENAAGGKWQPVFAALDKGAVSIDEKLGPRQRTLAHIAVSAGNLNVLEKLHEKGAALEGIYDGDGKGLIHHAVAKNNPQLVHWLAKTGVNLDDQGAPPQSASTQWKNEDSAVPPLHIAVMKRDMPMTQLLLVHGAAVDGQDHEGNTALMATSRKVTGATAFQRQLLGMGADIHAKNHNGTSVLMQVTEKFGTLKNASTLLDAGAVDEISREDYSQIHSNLSKISTVGGEAEVKLLPEFFNRPVIDATTKFKKEDLFAVNDAKIAPLDTHETWKNITQIADVLAETGNPLTKVDVLQTNADGKSWVQRAIECGGFADLNKALHAYDEAFKGSDFAQKEAPKKPNDLGVTADSCLLGQTEFSRTSTWKGFSADEVKKFRATLPENLQNEFGNYNSIILKLLTGERQPQKGR